MIPGSRCQHPAFEVGQGKGQRPLLGNFHHGAMYMSSIWYPGKIVCDNPLISDKIFRADFRCTDCRIVVRNIKFTLNQIGKTRHNYAGLALGNLHSRIKIIAMFQQSEIRKEQKEVTR